MVILQELRALTARVAMLRVMYSYEVMIMRKLPMLASLPEVLDKHHFNLEERAVRVHKRVAIQDERATEVDARLGRHLDAVDDVLSSNDKYLDGIERAISRNGSDVDVEAKKPIPTSGEGIKPSPAQHHATNQKI